MSYDSDLPFQRGQTFFGTETIVSGGGSEFEGAEYTVPDTIRNTGKPVTLRIVRNSCGFTLVPKRLVRAKAATAQKQVDGYTRTTAEAYLGIVDEAYAATGAPWRDGDLGYIVVEGDCCGKTDLAGAATGTLPEGTDLVSLTAATSGALTAGRVAAAVYTSLTEAALVAVSHNGVGRNMTARTSGNTDADILVNLRRAR